MAVVTGSLEGGNEGSPSVDIDIPERLELEPLELVAMLGSRRDEDWPRIRMS